MVREAILGIEHREKILEFFRLYIGQNNRIGVNRTFCFGVKLSRIEVKENIRFLIQHIPRHLEQYVVDLVKARGLSNSGPRSIVKTHKKNNPILEIVVTMLRSAATDWNRWGPSWTFR